MSGDISTIFISYRRGDSADICGRLYEHLEARFGKDHVLQDVESFLAGADFRAEIQRLLAQCDVLLAVIGPKWEGSTDSPDRLRVDDPGDFVRMEIEWALEHNIPIIPVLVSNASMPSDSALPRAISPLAYRNAVQLRSGRDFRRDVANIIHAIEDQRRARLPYRKPRPSPKVIAVSSLQGGSGKSTTAANLAAGLAEAGYNTLLIDLDPRGSAGICCGIWPEAITEPMVDWIDSNGHLASGAIRSGVRPNLAVLPARGSPFEAERRLASSRHPEYTLLPLIEILETAYDFLILDCPSSLNVLTYNALVAADGVLLPMPCDYFALQNMPQLLAVIKQVHSTANPGLRLFGIVLIKFDVSIRLSMEVVREVKDHFPEKVFETTIPRTADLAVAPSYGETIFDYSPESTGAQAYRSLVRETIQRMNIWRSQDVVEQ